ncbi:hypothetical protein EVAR_25454_1 [Eumeta japonica]|uniref:Uncharacterized protein n=1 Tax=Eumeta variegata TaxID=151549 RepID=A0A4C1VM04_EUMVA|nr:hypothetical protein EVAR_25454_1 [Eumeta japonica]
MSSNKSLFKDSPLTNTNGEKHQKKKIGVRLLLTYKTTKFCGWSGNATAHCPTEEPLHRRVFVSVRLLLTYKTTKFCGWSGNATAHCQRKSRCIDAYSSVCACCLRIKLRNSVDGWQRYGPLSNGRAAA